MQVRVGAIWGAPGGGQRVYDVIAEQSDITALVKSKNITTAQAIRQLSITSEILVVDYVHSQDGIGTETHRARVQELKEQLNAASA